MFLGCYHFDGDPTRLLEGYERMRATYPAESLDLHVCIVRDGGISVYDACPDRETFESFSSSADLAAVLAAADLPPARIERIGDVYAAIPVPRRS